MKLQLESRVQLTQSKPGIALKTQQLAIWKFISALKREQGLVEAKQAKYIGGEKPVKRLKNRANEDALTNLVQGYLNRPPLEFLKGVAYRFSIN